MLFNGIMQHNTNAAKQTAFAAGNLTRSPYSSREQSFYGGFFEKSFLQEIRRKKHTGQQQEIAEIQKRKGALDVKKHSQNFIQSFYRRDYDLLNQNYDIDMDFY